MPEAARALAHLGRPNESIVASGVRLVGRLNVGVDGAFLADGVQGAGCYDWSRPSRRRTDSLIAHSLSLIHAATAAAHPALLASLVCLWPRNLPLIFLGHLVSMLSVLLVGWLQGGGRMLGWLWLVAVGGNSLPLMMIRALTTILATITAVLVRLFSRPLVRGTAVSLLPVVVADARGSVAALVDHGLVAAHGFVEFLGLGQ